MKKQLALLLVCLFSLAATAEDCALGANDGEARIASFTVRQMQKFPDGKQGQFTAVLDGQSRLVKFGKEITGDIMQHHRRVSAYNKSQFSISSDCAFYSPPAKLYASLIEELTRNKYAVACEINAEPAVGAEATIKTLKNSEKKLLSLKCDYVQ